MTTAKHSAAQHKLMVTMPSDTEIRMERVFDAPRQLVWDAMTKPELITKWWGRKHTTTKVDKLEFRVGGAWRFVESEPDGSEHCFRGEFTKVAPIDGFAYTFEYEPMAGHVVVDDLTLTDLGRQTKVVCTSTFSSQEDRDGMMSAGMEEGASESYEKLDELLTSMKRSGGMTENKQTVERYMNSFNKLDHAQILSCLTDDIEWVIPGFFHTRGKPEFDRQIENDAFVGKPRIKVTRMTEEDDVVVAEGSVEAERTEGGIMKMEFCDVFEMRGGKIKRLISYLMEVKQH